MRWPVSVQHYSTLPCPETKVENADWDADGRDCPPAPRVWIRFLKNKCSQKEDLSIVFYWDWPRTRTWLHAH